MISPGRYVARAKPETLQFGFAKTGTEQCVLGFDLLNEGFEGRVVTWFGPLTDKAAEFTVRTLRDAGWIGDSLTDGKWDPSVEVALVAKTHVYQGEEKIDISIYPIGGTTIRVDRPIEGRALKALDAKFKGLIAASKRPARPTSTHERAKADGYAPPQKDDDLPF